MKFTESTHVNAFQSADFIGWKGYQKGDIAVSGFCFFETRKTSQWSGKNHRTLNSKMCENPVSATKFSEKNRATPCECERF